MRCSSVVRFVVGCLLGLFTASAWAQNNTYCVGTSGELAIALKAAETLSGTTYILIQGNGTYNVDLDQINAQGGLYLLGGYTDSTCSSRAVGATRPLFDGGGKAGDISVNGNLRVEGIAFVGNFGPGLIFTSAENSPQGLSLSLLNNIFGSNPVDISTGISATQQSIRILNNLFYNSSTQALSVSTFDNSIQITITGNTIYNPTYHGIDLCLDNGTASLYNNIVWGSHGYDINALIYETFSSNVVSGCPTSGPATIYVDHNIYGANMLNGNLGTGSNHNSNSDPQIDYVFGGDLASTSPAINAGNPSAPDITSVDDLGHPRSVGSAPDIGAWESSVDDTAPTTIIVTNANNEGGGSLRAAIDSANASGGTHYIEFNISSGTCPYVIGLATDLPYITAPGLSINGFTQPGSRKNDSPGFGSAFGDSAIRCIVLDGQGRDQSMGLVFYGASTGFYWVQGLAFERWGTALNISAGQNNLVWGNQFGGSLLSPGANADLPLSPNGIDIWLSGNTTTTTVGGTDPTDRNIIASAGASGSPLSPDAASYQGRGIAMSAGGGSGGNSIINNLIGMDAYEVRTTNGNAVGIQLETANNTITGNVIGNSNNGLQVTGGGANHNLISSNLIGVTEPYRVLCSPPPGGCPPDHSPAPNQAAIYFWQGANTNYVIDNTITNNSLFGIELTGTGTYRNEIVANSIYGNPASWASNGAEINLDGYSYGNNQPSTTPNRELNYPLIDSVVGSSSVGTIKGRLESIDGAYSIEVFSSPACEAGGAYAHNPIGATTISDAFSDPLHGIYINGSGTFSFNFTSAYSLSGRYITATAIDGYGNTSEFSACKLYQCDVIFRHGFEGSTGEHCP